MTPRTQSLSEINDRLKGHECAGLIPLPAGQTAIVFTSGRILVTGKVSMPDPFTCQQIMNHVQEVTRVASHSIEIMERVSTPSIMEEKLGVDSIREFTVPDHPLDSEFSGTDTLPTPPKPEAEPLFDMPHKRKVLGADDIPDHPFLPNMELTGKVMESSVKVEGWEVAPNE